MDSVSQTVCVTGADGYIGSWLVKSLIEQGYTVRATIYPANMKNVKHLLDLPDASTKLSLWKADMTEEGSFDEAIKGCSGLFHLATPMDFDSKDPEMYLVSKTLAEQEAWKFTTEHKMELITTLPTLVVGPFIVPTMPPSLITALSPITGTLQIEK